MLRKDIPDGNTSSTVFPYQPNLPPYSRPDSNYVADHIDDSKLRLKDIPHRMNCKKF